jgi:hypothetical protein
MPVFYFPWVIERGCGMENGPFTASDLERMRTLGIDPEKARKELGVFTAGQSFATLERACGPGDGIMKIPRQERDALADGFGKVAAAGRASQFVPASGAATRMFKSLLEVLGRKDAPDFHTLVRECLKGDPVAEEFLAWFQGLDSFPFREELARVLSQHGLDLEALIESQDYRPILECLVRDEGLGYAERPKALIPFHAYPDGARLALEEHLAEAKDLVRDAAGLCRLHFTVSPRHKSAFMETLEKVRGRHESGGTRFQIAISEQHPSTDTLAADEDGRPFRDADGNLVFRPGGHGALLGNLAACGGDIVFIKNIDNIVPDLLRPEITAWRRAMGGLLANVQAGIYRRIWVLRASSEAQTVAEAVRFAENSLGVVPSDEIGHFQGVAALERTRAWLLRILDRPIRVCAMVENRGEPGGGPFWVRHEDGSLRLQIVETPQVDPRDERQSSIAAASAFFNPTDLVCGLLNSAGKPFDLRKFADPEAGFITRKSKDGRTLKALELPGLWNGSMADWNTVFIEAPAEIFNPVKTVGDLLRPGHAIA